MFLEPPTTVSQSTEEVRLENRKLCIQGKTNRRYYEIHTTADLPGLFHSQRAVITWTANKSIFRHMEEFNFPDMISSR